MHYKLDVEVQHLMYLNYSSIFTPLSTQIVEVQHLMYLNFFKYLVWS